MWLVGIIIVFIAGAQYAKGRIAEQTLASEYSGRPALNKGIVVAQNAPGIQVEPITEAAYHQFASEDVCCIRCGAVPAFGADTQSGSEWIV